MITTNKKNPRKTPRTEKWKGRRVKVFRNPHGRFVSWHWIRPYHRGITATKKWTYRELMPTGKSLAVFGQTRQGSKRWELHKGSATGIEWQNAVGLAREHPPKHHFRRIYVRDMYWDEFEGEWIEEPEVKS